MWRRGRRPPLGRATEHPRSSVRARQPLGRLLAAIFFVLVAVVPAGAQRYRQGTAHITTQTTTTIITNLQTTRALTIMAGSVCVDADGGTTAVTIRDSTGLNLFGTGTVWVLSAGSCLNFPYRGYLYGVPTGLGASIQLVTGTGNGPVEVYLEVINQ